MKHATTTSDFSRYTKNQVNSMEYIAKAGFKYIDYNFCRDYSNQCGIYAATVKEYAEILKRQADKLGLQFVQAHSPMGKPLAENNGEFIDATLKSIDLCGELGIKNIVVHSGYLLNLTKEETYEKNKQFFMPLIQRAEKYGINVLVENFNKMHIENMYWIDNAPDLLEMIEYVNHPLFHAVWDAGHGNMQEMPQHESLKILGSHVMALHIQDNMGDNDTHMAPFFGTMNIDSLMHGLIDIGYNGYFTFESENIMLPPEKRRAFETDTRLLAPSLELRIKAENLLYEIGKHILQSYNCFDE